MDGTLKGAENPKHLVNLAHSHLPQWGWGRSETAEHKAGHTFTGGEEFVEVQPGFFKKINEIISL